MSTTTATQSQTQSPAENKMTGAQILWASLEREGVQTVFGYPGGAILPVYDALKHSAIRHILVRHEQGATHMADGFARASGKIGVAMATSGPGATNMVTGIATAMLDSSPIVCITGQVGSKFIGSDAFQEVDITGITLPITKHNYLVTRAEDIARTVREAFYIAQSGRPGPVLIDITKDAQQSSCVFDWEGAAPQLPGYRPDLSPSVGDYDKAIELIRAAKRPIILAGHGIILSGATQEVCQLIEHLDIPAAVTLLGLGGIPASHPLNLGMMGMHGEAWVNTAIQEADLLIALGMRFDDRVTGNLNTYAKNAKKIHVEIDPAEINKNVKVDVALVGDLREVLRELQPMLESTPKHPEWVQYINQLKGDSAVRDIQNLPDSGHLYAAHVINDLWRETGGNAIVVTDVGLHQMWKAQYNRHNTPRSIITSGGLVTMGFALPAVIGAKVASRDAEVWVVVGDGGFQMTMPELATIFQEKIKIHVAIINNGYLGMVRQWQDMFFEERFSQVRLTHGLPDYAQLARAYGALGFTVESEDELEDALAAALASGRTAVVDARVDQSEHCFPMIPSGAAALDVLEYEDDVEAVPAA